MVDVLYDNFKKYLLNHQLSTFSFLFQVLMYIFPAFVLDLNPAVEVDAEMQEFDLQGLAT